MEMEEGLEGVHFPSSECSSSDKPLKAWWAYLS
jgi:hypothetical protein